MVKRFFIFSFFVFPLVLNLAAYAFDDDLTQCGRTDAVCVGKILLEKMNQLKFKDPSNMTVEFYRSDDCVDRLLATVVFDDSQSANDARCRRYSEFVDEKVWGIKVKGGKCSNIIDTDFLSACRRFI